MYSPRPEEMLQFGCFMALCVVCCVCCMLLCYVHVCVIVIMLLLSLIGCLPRPEELWLCVDCVYHAQACLYTILLRLLCVLASARGVVAFW